MSNIRPEYMISATDLRTRQKVKSLEECLQDRSLQWFTHLERVKESAWPSKCRTFKVSDSFPRGRPRKTWNEVIKSNLKERKVSKGIAQELVLPSVTCHALI